MEFEIKGVKNDPAECVLNISPTNGNTIVKGEQPNQVIFQPSTNFVNVGQFPCTAKFMVLFSSRPWKIEVQQKNGTYFTTTNIAQGLANSVIITPDIINITLKFEI